ARSSKSCDMVIASGVQARTRALCEMPVREQQGSSGDRPLVIAARRKLLCKPVQMLSHSIARERLAMSRRNNQRIQFRQFLDRSRSRVPIPSEVSGRPMQLRRLRDDGVEERLGLGSAERIAG